VIKNYQQFNILSKQGLVHAVFKKKLGNFSLKHGSLKSVKNNKKNAARILGINKEKIISVQQYHSNKIITVQESCCRTKEQKADGMITDSKNIFILIKTADCFPVLFYCPQKKVVAGVHVGWRGAVGKIFLKVVLEMIVRFECQVSDILVGIGPGIRKCCFKHQSLIQEQIPEWENYIASKSDGKSLDLAGFIKDELISIGIKKQNVEDMGICSCCNKDFYSHRRSLRTGEKEGRFATVFGMVEY